MDKDNIIKFPAKESSCVDPDEILDLNKGVFDILIIGGIDKNGDFVFGASTSDRPQINYIIDKFKQFVMD